MMVRSHTLTLVIFCDPTVTTEATTKAEIVKLFLMALFMQRHIFAKLHTYTDTQITREQVEREKKNCIAQKKQDEQTLIFSPSGHDVEMNGDNRILMDTRDSLGCTVQNGWTNGRKGIFILMIAHKFCLPVQFVRPFVRFFSRSPFQLLQRLMLAVLLVIFRIGQRATDVERPTLSF